MRATAIPSFGDWLEIQQSCGAPAQDIEAAIATDRRLRAALSICRGLFDAPAQATVIAVFDQICRLTIPA